MRKISRFFFLFLILLFSIGASTTGGQAQTHSIFFEETGFWVKGAFLEMYQSVDDPLLLFGYPISEEITDVESGMVSQYFQKVRMDMLDDVVRLAALGQELYTPGQPLQIDPSRSSTCQYFHETKKSVCYAFSRFYDENNGREYFGLPISNIELQGGRYVQYFEKAKMVLHPELPSGEKVALVDLGRVYSDLHGVSAQSNGSAIIGQFVRPSVRAFVSEALIASNSEQTLYVIAQDQHLEPIEGAMVLVSIHWLDGQVENFRPEPTNEHGISVSSFMVGEVEPRQVVEIEVQITYQEIEAETSTWFRTWW